MRSEGDQPARCLVWPRSSKSDPTRLMSPNAFPSRKLRIWRILIYRHRSPRPYACHAVTPPHAHTCDEGHPESEWISVSLARQPAQASLARSVFHHPAPGGVGPSSNGLRGVPQQLLEGAHARKIAILAPNQETRKFLFCRYERVFRRHRSIVRPCSEIAMRRKSRNINGDDVFARDSENSQFLAIGGPLPWPCGELYRPFDSVELFAKQNPLDAPVNHMPSA